MAMGTPEQGEFFGPAVPRFGRRKGRKPTARLAVLRAIRSAEPQGLTVDEVERLLRLTHQTASARVHELRRAGLVVDSGRKRMTRNGREATVWRPAKEGCQP
jgi:predicted transcriptional regulator